MSGWVWIVAPFVIVGLALLSMYLFPGDRPVRHYIESLESTYDEDGNILGDLICACGARVESGMQDVAAWWELHADMAAR